LQSNSGAMRLELIEQVPSFQQEVWRATVNGEPAYAKRIVSNYSWWTCEESDIYAREKCSYQLLNSAGIRPQLLAHDDETRQLILEAIETTGTTNENQETLCDSLVDTLKTLRGLRPTSLEKLSALRLAGIYAEKGRAAGVKLELIQEIVNILNEWHQRYGTELAFTHGDFHGGNWRHDGRRITAIIDFEESIESLPVFDASLVAYAFREAPALFQRFERRYEDAFGEALICVSQWRRFSRLRGWIVSCYLRECCAPDIAHKARGFLLEDEP
jgi:hypothetical protein